MTDTDNNAASEELAPPKFSEEEGLPYLWHLISIGLISAREGICPSSLSDGGGDAKAQKKTADDDPKTCWEFVQKSGWPGEESDHTPLVAIIDNGACRDHPNLDESKFKHRIDFTAHREGQVFNDSITGDFPSDIPRYEEQKKAWAEHIDSLISNAIEEKLNKSGTIDDGERAQFMKTMNCVFQHLSSGPVGTPSPDPSHRFASHGTACAGLVGGKPLGQSDKKNPWAINYIGVAPHADIIPINTPYNYEYWPVTFGFIWAFIHGADVILMPRAVFDLPARECGEGYGMDRPDLNARHTRLDDPASDEYQRLWAEKQQFENVLSVVSTLVPVVVSAGNDGTAALQYPARLQKDCAPHLIPVGACTARGIKSAYSNGKTEDANLLFAPSDDLEAVTAEHFRYERRDWRGRQLNMDIARPGVTNAYTSFGVLAVDIPGVWGYSNTFDEDMEFNDEGQSGDLSYTEQHSPAALYTVFGGTSAASSIVAGIAALVQKQKGYLTGSEMRQLLLDKAVEGANLLPDLDNSPPRVTKMVHAQAAFS